MFCRWQSHPVLPVDLDWETLAVLSFFPQKEDLAEEVHIVSEVYVALCFECTQPFA